MPKKVIAMSEAGLSKPKKIKSTTKVVDNRRKK
jgi:hypothetical protein